MDRRHRRRPARPAPVLPRRLLLLPRQSPHQRRGESSLRRRVRVRQRPPLRRAPRAGGDADPRGHPSQPARHRPLARGLLHAAARSLARRTGRPPDREPDCRLAGQCANWPSGPRWITSSRSRTRRSGRRVEPAPARPDLRDELRLQDHETEAGASRRHYDERGRALLADVIDAESADGRRVIAENEHAIAFVPYFARYAYEVFVSPKRTHASIATLDDAEARDLGRGARRNRRPLRQPVADAVSLRHAAAPGADRRRRLSRLPLPHRVPSAAAQAEPPQVPRRTGSGRRQLSRRHIAGREGGGPARGLGHALHTHGRRTRGTDANRTPDTPAPDASVRHASRSSTADTPNRMPAESPASIDDDPSRPRRHSPARAAQTAARDDSMRVVAACEAATIETLAAIDREAETDTIYTIDTVGEAVLVDFFAREIAPWAPLVLVAEGLDPDGITLPIGTSPRDAAWRVIVDPIDGTRGLMYQKRSAWVLTGVAPNRGDATTIADIVLAVQTEVPLVKQHLYDALWAARGGGARAERVNRLAGSARRSSAAVTSADNCARLRRNFSLLPRRHARIWPQLMMRSCWRRWDRCNPARRTASRISTCRSGGQLVRIDDGTRSVHRRSPAAARAVAGRARPHARDLRHPTISAPNSSPAKPAPSSPQSTADRSVIRSRSRPMWRGPATPIRPSARRSNPCCVPRSTHEDCGSTIAS